MHYIIKELHEIITILSNEEGLSKHGETLLEGYAIRLQAELVSSSNVIPDVRLSCFKEVFEKFQETQEESEFYGWLHSKAHEA